MSYVKIRRFVIKRAAVKDVVKIPQSKTVASMDGKRVFGRLEPDSWPNELISAGSIAVDMASVPFHQYFLKRSFY